MSGNACYLKGCKNTPIAICKCFIPFYLLCKDHINDHIRSKSRDGHRLQDKLPIPDALTREVLIENARKFKQEIEASKLEVLKEASKLTKHIEAIVEFAMNQLNQLDEMCDDLIKMPKRYSELTNIRTGDVLENLRSLDSKNAL